MILIVMKPNSKIFLYSNTVFLYSNTGVTLKKNVLCLPIIYQLENIVCVIECKK